MTDLLMPFDTDAPEFTRGFECGQLWELACPGYVRLIHATNTEMALRVAEAKGLSAVGKDAGDDWIEVTFR